MESVVGFEIWQSILEDVPGFEEMQRVQRYTGYKGSYEISEEGVLSENFISEVQIHLEVVPQAHVHANMS